MELCEKVPYCSASPEKSQGVAARDWLRNSLNTVARWHTVMVERRSLRKYASDPGFLKDIGVSLADAMQEADKPFWQR